MKQIDRAMRTIILLQLLAETLEVNDNSWQSLRDAYVKLTDEAREEAKNGLNEFMTDKITQNETD